MRVLENLGKLRIDQGHFAEAEPLLRDVLKSQRRLGGNKRGATLCTMNTLVVSLTKKKDYTEAEHCGEPYKIYLDIEQSGLHTIEFSMREDGFEFDKWLMTQDRNFARPEGSGPTERYLVRSEQNL